MRIAFALSVLVVLLPPAVSGADDPAWKGVVSKQAKRVTTAVVERDFELFAKLTHPKLVEEMGGPKKFVAYLEAESVADGRQGFEILDTTLEPPGEWAESESNLFVIIPYEIEIRSPKGRLLTKSFLIGISADKGKEWKFLDGNGPIDKVKKIVPDFPDSLKLPKKQRPVLKSK